MAIVVATRALFLASVVFVVLYIYLLLEEGRELKVWEKAGSTISLYNTPENCMDHESDDGSPTTTITSTIDEGLLNDKDHIINCGHCGKCSNQSDIQIYNETRDTLTGLTTECTKGGLYRGRDMNYVKKCLEEASGLSGSCVDCWVINVNCNWEFCFRTCIKHKVAPFRWLPSLYHRAHESPIDPCLECDERMCGPLFIECAGANRRRVGVVSDIQRNADLEICSKVDWDWIQSKSSKVKDSGAGEKPEQSKRQPILYQGGTDTAEL